MSQGLVFFIIFILKCKKKERGGTLSKYPIVAEAGAQSRSPTWVAGFLLLKLSPAPSCISRKLESGLDLRLKPRYSDVRSTGPKQPLTHWATTPMPVTDFLMAVSVSEDTGALSKDSLLPALLVEDECWKGSRTLQAYGPPQVTLVSVGVGAGFLPTVCGC